jgi:signal transduction histidine kinase
VLTPLSGIFPAIGIGTRYLVAVRAGRTLGIADTVHDPLTADSQFGTIGARAIIGVPIIRGGRWHAGFYINHATVRRWTDAEIALAHDIGEQTWDAVERARAEAALREAQARRLAEEQQHAARLQQLNAASLAINAAATRNDVLNLIAEQARALIGAKQAVVDVVPDSSGSQMQAVGSLDERLARSEHETRPQRNAIMAAPLTDSDGARIGTLQLVDKVAGGFTAADEALLQQLAQMASVALENQTLYAQEQELRAQAEEASRLKDEFLATVSHELRTPLTAVLGYAQLLRARKRDEAYVARTAEKLVRSAKDQALIIDDLLDVSRIVSGKLRIEPQPIDLISVIEAALDTVRPAVEARQLQLHVALNPEASTIIGDANRLQQVVWNLLSNATKFTPPGGIIQILLEPDGRDAWLTIRDTGQGIRPAFLPFVFDRFRQADSASNRAHGGLGLGLAIVRNLVELHGGSVQAASDGEGHGSTFTVRLPLDRIGDAPVSVQPMADDPPPDCPPVLRGLRVLVVDDQPDIVELLHDILATCGAVVMTCSGAQEALAALRAWKPAVLVSDIAMPGADGYWLIERVRALALEDGGGTPAVALTAYVRAEERERVLAAGFQLYVPKPVDPAELRYVIAHLARIEALD